MNEDAFNAKKNEWQQIEKQWTLNEKKMEKKKITEGDECVKKRQNKNHWKSSEKEEDKKKKKQEE